MGCRNNSTPAMRAKGLRVRREIIRQLFESGNTEGGQRQRWSLCAHSSDCTLACPNLDKEAGQKPSCVDAKTGKVIIADLYEALKKLHQQCPLDFF